LLKAPQQRRVWGERINDLGVPPPAPGSASYGLSRSRAGPFGTCFATLRMPHAKNNSYNLLSQKRRWMPRENRNDSQMRAFAEKHLTYEVHMLLVTFQALSSSSNPQHITNAYLESFTIHLRALIDFLWELQSPRNDDAIASDFFSSKEQWLKVQPKFPQILEPARARTGKEIVHLTYARMDVSAEAKHWQIKEMMDSILACLKIFVNNAEIRYLGNALAELKNDHV
jgi:hypothetical protein